MRLFLCCCAFALRLAAQTLTPVWLELGPSGVAVARVVVEPATRCPNLQADGQTVAMGLRQPVPEGLKPLCEVSLSATVRTVRFGKQQINIPKELNRAVAIGDTGCRVKGGQVQACDDPNLWPFTAISAQVARLKPDLIVHVGDFLYRESVCPDMVHGCAGPHGDNWDAWNADFFEPARAALAVAPWIFARGNHESCERSFRGWFYYLDPRAFSESCHDYSEPYITTVGSLRIAVLDTASTKDNPHAQSQQIPIYARQLRDVSGRADWLVDHHPFWAFTNTNGVLASTELTLGPAWSDAKPSGIDLVLSGHVHLFEFLALEDGRPNQIIAGDSGTQLDAGLTVDRSGSSIVGAKVKTGEVNMSFGLTELQRKGSGWALTLRDAQGVAHLACDIPSGSAASCQVNPK